MSEPESTYTLTDLRVRGLFDEVQELPEYASARKLLRMLGKFAEQRTRLGWEVERLRVVRQQLMESTWVCFAAAEAVYKLICEVEHHLSALQVLELTVRRRLNALLPL